MIREGVATEVGDLAQLSTEQLRSVVESAADAIVIIDGVRDIRYANPAATELFGRGLESLVGRPFGYPVVGDGTPAKIDLLRPDGRRLLVEMRVTQLRWGDDELATMAVMRDTTDPITHEVSGLSVHMRGLSLRVAELERRIAELERRET